jgi:hypothetical protein
MESRQKTCQSMIMSYIQPWRTGLGRLESNLGVATEQLRQVALGSHHQALGNPTDRDGGLGAELGSQAHLERMPGGISTLASSSKEYERGRAER